MKDDAFILFLRYPEPGQVKTRIARKLGNDRACELYRCFMKDIAVMSHGVCAETILVYSGPENAVFPDFTGIRCIRQKGEGIGERMYYALTDVFALGFKRCVLIGSDSPDLPERMVNEAFDRLVSHDVVLGPSCDGGYYLIGCNRAALCRSIFSDIPWSTGGVLSATLNRIAEAGLLYTQLEEWSDIDEIEDLNLFYKRNDHQKTMYQTMKYLDTIGIVHV
ncbi:MAG: hypothetical protein CVU51_02125 [Deltaproteobacteria bacterium HGW-Deltaproteobacteria-1]|jgi:hypothetical protein|nr:MAG: hypothetical protein CVU51_02125 [Deltaproteobacteria bacterium HGW-Deltaproteobacteria-1]